MILSEDLPYPFVFIVAIFIKNLFLQIKSFNILFYLEIPYEALKLFFNKINCINKKRI